MLAFLLDTNTATNVIKRKPLAAMTLFNTHIGHLAISSITLAELPHGSEKSNAPAQALAVVEDFCRRPEVLTCGTKAAKHYGSIRASQGKIGQPIGVNDILNSPKPLMVTTARSGRA